MESKQTLFNPYKRELDYNDCQIFQDTLILIYLNNGLIKVYSFVYKFKKISKYMGLIWIMCP